MFTYDRSFNDGSRCCPRGMHVDNLCLNGTLVILDCNFCVYHKKIRTRKRWILLKETLHHPT